MDKLPIASRELVLELACAMINAAKTKLEQRNKQYAKDADGLANLRHCEEYGVSAEQGIIVRMADKMQRINTELYTTAIHPSRLLESENGIDNNDILDIINYAALLYAVRVTRFTSTSEKHREAYRELMRAIDHPSDRLFGGK